MHKHSKCNINALRDSLFDQIMKVKRWNVKNRRRRRRSRRLVFFFSFVYPLSCVLVLRTYLRFEFCSTCINLCDVINIIHAPSGNVDLTKRLTDQLAQLSGMWKCHKCGKPVYFGNLNTHTHKHTHRYARYLHIYAHIWITICLNN